MLRPNFFKDTYNSGVLQKETPKATPFKGSYTDNNEFETEIKNRVSDSFKKYGNTDAFRADIVQLDADFKLSKIGKDSAKKSIVDKYTSEAFTESLLMDLQKNPTIDNYNKFVQTQYKTPFANAKYNGNDALAVATGIMWKNNKDFSIDDDAYAKKVFAEDEKAISDLENKKQEKQKEQKSVSVFNTLNDLGAEIGDMGLQAAGILIPGKAGDKLESNAAARRDARQDKKEENAKIANEISEINDEIKLRKANLEWNKKYYDVSNRSDFAEKNHRIAGKSIKVYHPQSDLPLGELLDGAKFDENGVNFLGLTKEQVETFYYIGNTQGDKAAEKFLKDILPLTAPESANFQYNMVKDIPGIKQLTGIGQNLIGGTMGQLEGIANAGASLIGKTVDFTVDPMTGAEPFNKNAKGLEKGVYGVAQGVGQMLPAIATRGLGGTASQVVFGAGVYGNTYKEAKDKGYDQLTSMGYGIANTAMELALEEMGGFTVGGGKGKLSMPKAISSKIDDVFKASPKTRAIASIGANMAGQFASEFTEEYLAATFDPVLRNVFLSEDNDFTLISKQQIEDGLIGGFTGLILGSPSYARNIASTFKKGNYGAEKAFYLGASDSFIESEMVKSNPDSFNGLSEEQKSKAVVDYRLQKVKEAGYNSIYGNLIKGVAEGKSLDGIKSDIADEGVNVYDYFNGEQLERAYTIAKQTAETSNKTTDADVLRRVASTNAQPMSQETILDTARKLINDGKSNAEIIDTITTLDNTKAPNDVRELVRSIKDTAFINSFPSGMTNAQKAQAIKDYVAKENELDLQYINSKQKTTEATSADQNSYVAPDAATVTPETTNVNAKDAVVNIANNIKATYKEAIKGAVKIDDISTVITPAIVDDVSDETVIKGLADLYVKELEKKQSQLLEILERGTGDRNTAVDTLYEYALTGAVSSGKDAKKVTKVVEPFKDIVDSAISQVRNARSAVSKATVPVTSTVQEAKVEQADVTSEAVSKTENVIENQDEAEVEKDVETIAEEMPENNDKNAENIVDNNDKENKVPDLTDKCVIHKTKHTQTGEDIWVISVKDRLSKEQYNDLSKKAKDVGGYYSRFAKDTEGNAIPGFVFKSEPDAEVIGVFNNFFGDKSSEAKETEAEVEETKTEVEETEAKETEVKVIDEMALFKAVKNAKAGDEIKLSDFEKQSLTEETENDTIEEKADKEVTENEASEYGTSSQSADEARNDSYNTRRDADGKNNVQKELFSRTDSEGNSIDKEDSARNEKSVDKEDSKSNENRTLTSLGNTINGVYHGSPYKFSNFEKSYTDAGIHFGTKEQAESRVSDSEQSYVEEYNITLNNPLVTKDVFGERTPETLVDDLIENSELTETEKNTLRHRFDEYSENEIRNDAIFSLNEKLDNNKYHLLTSLIEDGVVVKMASVDDLGKVYEVPLAEIIDLDTLLSVLGAEKVKNLYKTKQITEDINESLSPIIFDSLVHFETIFVKFRKIETILKDFGYDGFKYENENEGEGVSYAVFDDSQITKISDNNHETKQEDNLNDRRQADILEPESEGLTGGNETQEVQSDEEGRDLGTGDNTGSTASVEQVSNDAGVVEGKQNTAEGVRNTESDSGHDSDSESGERNDGERGSNGSSDVPARRLNSHNYKITEDIDNKRPNINDNLEAIKLLKQLEESGKTPTKEQQAILAKYKGWGGLKNAFTDFYYIRQLKEVMTEEEFKNARAGVLDAFYTSTKLISGIYKGLSRLGFKGGNILEPSMGTGNFFGVMPSGIASKSNLYGVEIDSITGRIAKYLYPDANIEIAPFQDVNYPEGTFDTVVGNVPFVDVPYSYKGSKYMLHDYFFIKSLDTLKEGGIAALLTTTGTLDKTSSKARHEIAKRANIIAAFRLPNNAFAANAGTNVTTDLIILQKRGDTVPFNGIPFERLSKIGDIVINEYFANNPENILGELTTSTGMYGNERSVVEPYKDTDFAKVFDKAILRLPKDLLTASSEVSPIDIQAISNSKSHFEVKGKDVIFYDSDTKEVTVLSGKAKDRAKAYIAVKDAYTNLIDSSKAGASKTERDALRSELNKAYDDFYGKFGSLQDKANKSLEEDSDFIKVTGIELYNPDKKQYEKSGIFTTDTIGYIKPVKADTSLDALAISINETGSVNLKRISSLTGKTVEETIADLEGSIIKLPDGEYELIPVYTSGNIREKLAQVEGKKGFEKNVEILKSVMPKDKAPSEILPQLGASWIPAKYISDFIKDVFSSYYPVQVNYDPTSGTWTIEKFWSDRDTMSRKYGTSRASAYDLLVDTINLKSAKVYDTTDKERVFNKKETALARQKQAEIKEAFSNWIFKDADRRSDLVKNYNELFNSHRNMDFAQLSKYLTFPGLKSSWKMRDYQKAAVARVVFGGNTLLAHGVGTGKTCEMIASAMEMKRMGITKKNVFVVPKHKIGDFRNDILKMYPEAKVLMATEKDFEKKNRGKLFSKIGTNDWDIVIIGHSSFGLLPVSSQTQAAYIEKQKTELEDVITRAKKESGQKLDKRFVSGLEKSLKSLEARLHEALDSKKDDTITFEELGIDGLFVDEAHNFKNLPFYSKLNLPGIKGGTSKRASDMYMKTEYLRERGGRIVFATATPITNSVSEFYNMTRFVSPETLKSAGIYSFDSWASTFGSIETKMEMSPDGKNFRTKERFSKYNNVREMVGLFRQFADILRTGDVVKDLPKANYIDVISPSLDIHDAYINGIIERMKRVSSKGADKSDNMLLITNDGRAMATDLRLVASQLEAFPDADLDVPTSRINKAVSNIVTEYKKSDKIKGTQFVFLDFGMNANEEGRYNYNLYGDLISKLIEGGIPESEIAQIGDYDTVAKKDALFKKVNDGEIRVLIGSTAKMGEGMNAQQRAVALHHLNAPYRPSDIEQREGRIIRHGNINKDVNIYRYIQEKSFDSYMWQMLARKGEFINQALSNGDVSELEETDEFVLSAKTGMAVATGNPLILKKVEIDEEVKRLQNLKKSYDASYYDMQERLAKLPLEIESMTQLMKRVSNDIKTLEANQSEDFSIKIGKKVYDKRADAAKALVPLIKNKYGASGSEVIGSYRGLNLTLTKSYTGGILYIGNEASLKIELGESAEGNITKIVNAAGKFDSYLKYLEKQTGQLESELKSIKQDINLPFKYQSDLDKALAEQADINTQLNFGEDNSEVFEDMNDDFKSQDEIDEEENDSDEKTKYFLERRKESEQQTERKSLLHGRTGQTDIQSSGKQDERLYGDAGAKAGRTFEERRNYAKEIVSQKGYFDIVDEDGHVKFIDEKFLNDEMRNIESLCYKFGRNVRFMLGGMYVKDYGTAYGVKTKNNEILVSYTAAESPWQICRHEIIHTEFNNERFQKYKKVVTDYLTGDVLEKALLLPRYQNYSDFMETTQDVIEEMICDIFAGSAPEELALFDDTVEAYWKDTLGTNGSPVWLNELMSDDLFKKNKPFLSTEDGADFEESEYEFSDEWEDKVEEFGAIPQGENPVREVNVPKKISKTQPVSRFARTMMEAEVTPEFAMSEFEKRILDGTMTHEVITNKDAEKKAIKEIEYDGFEDSLIKWQGVVDAKAVSKYALVKGQVLYNQCITNKDVSNAMKVAADLTALATQAGQTLQACRVLKLMSPDGQLYYLEKSVKKMNDEFREKLGKKFDNIILDEDLMEAFLKAESEEAKNKAYDDLCQDIADQIPATKLEKWNNWRYLAMLGNLRTHIRNFFGNAVFVPAIRIRNHLAAIGEQIAKVPIEERRRSHYKTKEAIEFAKQDFPKVKDILMAGGSKYVENSKINDRRTIFKTRWLEYLRKKNFAALEAEDGFFLKRHYVDTLARIITARKLDINKIDGQLLENLRDFAIKQSAEYTYRDANALASALNQLKSGKGRAFAVLVEGVMPFTKTPLNIAKQGVLYSPAGILTGISKARKAIKRNGELSVQDAIDEMCKGLTGTGMMMIGFFLAYFGLFGITLNGGDDEDDKKQRFEEMVGAQSYSLNVFGHSYTIDWMAPSSLPMFVGVALAELMKDEGLTMAETLSALSGIAEPLFELSVFSGVSDAINAAKYNKTNVATAILTDVGSSYLMQALPTIGGQLSRIRDSQKREYYYYDKNNKYLPGDIQRIIGQVASKVPTLSFLFAKSVDEWGRDESYGGIVERFLENTVSPGYYSKENYTEVDNELLRLYNETKDNVVFPPSISKSFSDGGIKYNLTAKEYEEYKRDIGQRAFQYVYDLINSEEYDEMSNSEKKNAITKCYERARDEAKLNYLASNELTLGRNKDYKGLSEEQAKEQGYFTKDEYKYVENELFAVMDAAAGKNVFPTEQNNYYTVDGEKREMTDEQHKEATSLRYNKSMELLLKFFNDEKIQGVKSYSRCKNNDEVVDALKDIYRMAGDYTKDIMLEKVLAND